eukprot:14977857-Alexandrium_andersonii.AAC.1
MEPAHDSSGMAGALRLEPERTWLITTGHSVSPLQPWNLTPMGYPRTPPSTPLRPSDQFLERP